MPPKRAEVKVDEEKKQAMSRASTTTAKKDIDPSWLVGTNADIKKKVREIMRYLELRRLHPFLVA